MDWHTTAIPRSGRLAGLDFETTGLRPPEARVVSVGIVVLEDGKLVECYESFVQPGRSMPSEAGRVNGITDKMLANAPTWQDVHEFLADLTRDALVVSHRLPFEASFWAAENERSGLPSPRRAGMCSKLLAGAAGLRGSATGLRSACGACGINIAATLNSAAVTPNTSSGWHSALWDAAGSALLADWILNPVGPLEGPERARAIHDRLATGGSGILARYMSPHQRDVDLYQHAARRIPASPVPSVETASSRARPVA